MGLARTEHGAGAELNGVYWMGTGKPTAGFNLGNRPNIKCKERLPSAVWETDCTAGARAGRPGRECRARGRVTVRGGQPLLGRGGELRIRRWDTGVREGE